MKGEGGISGAGWRYIEAAAGLLAPLEREVVLGDLAEMDCGAWRGLGDVLGLAARRQLALWRSWRPFAASGAVASLLGEPAQARLLWLSLSRLFLVISWAWTAGFVMGAVSRGTLWASVLGCCGPCLYCLSEWP